MVSKLCPDYFLEMKKSLFIKEIENQFDIQLIHLFLGSLFKSRRKMKDLCKDENC